MFSFVPICPRLRGLKAKSMQHSCRGSSRILRRFTKLRSASKMWKTSESLMRSSSSNPSLNDELRITRFCVCVSRILAPPKYTCDLLHLTNGPWRVCGGCIEDPLELEGPSEGLETTGTGTFLITVDVIWVNPFGFGSLPGYANATLSTGVWSSELAVLCIGDMTDKVCRFFIRNLPSGSTVGEGTAAWRLTSDGFSRGGGCSLGGLDDVLEETSCSWANGWRTKLAGHLFDEGSISLLTRLSVISKPLPPMPLDSDGNRSELIPLPLIRRTCSLILFMSTGVDKAEVLEKTAIHDSGLNPAASCCVMSRSSCSQSTSVLLLFAVVSKTRAFAWSTACWLSGPCSATLLLRLANILIMCSEALAVGVIAVEHRLGLEDTSRRVSSRRVRFSIEMLLVSARYESGRKWTRFPVVLTSVKSSVISRVELSCGSEMSESHRGKSVFSLIVLAGDGEELWLEAAISLGRRQISDRSRNESTWPAT